MHNTKQCAVICDIDGCLLDTRLVLAEAESKTDNDADKWLYFEKYANDRAKVKFNRTLGAVLSSLHNSGYAILLSTARSITIAQETTSRLKDEMGYGCVTYMRYIDDLRPACEVKAEHLKEIQKWFNPVIAIDDEDDNLKMFAKNGLLVMKLGIN